MRLLQGVLPTLPQTKKPQRKFIAHLFGLLLMLPGHATFRNLSRYSSYHERSFARCYDRPFDFVALNKSHLQNPNGTSRAKFSDLIFGNGSVSNTPSGRSQHFSAATIQRR